MSTNAYAWPVCPRPETDESLPSWFERVSHEYTMSPVSLLGVIERAESGRAGTAGAPDAGRLLDRTIADRLAVLGQLSGSEINAFWPPSTGWELHDHGFSVYCPYCCFNDFTHGRTPYGRRCWQQSWCTICQVHSIALVHRNQTHASSNRSHWSHAKLKRDRAFLASVRYRGLKVTHEPAVRSSMLSCLMHLERTAAAAISGSAPNQWIWGILTADEFLAVLTDVTTWSLTHFESVRSWSAAEDLTPAEEQEGYGLVGRYRRMSTTDYGDHQMTRTLRDVGSPKVRGAALWAAHAFMATCHSAASDRPSGPSAQDRQAAWISRSPPAARHWLAERQESWPSAHRRDRWIEVWKLL